jgi:hypothetical protein
MKTTTTGSAVDLYWIPLGAGGHSVRFNGIVYEAISAAIRRRQRRDIYHSALVVRTPAGPVSIEMTPVPDGRGAERGVVASGPVGVRCGDRFRIFRYEVRRWLNGLIPDLQYAIASPVHLTDDATVAQLVLDLLPFVPTPTWGRDMLGTGEMWSCNSVISWVLTQAGVDVDTITLPPNARAPGWDAGIAVGRRGLAPPAFHAAA